MICEGDELFRVEGHCGMPMLVAGPQASTCIPDVHLYENRLRLKADLWGRADADAFASWCAHPEYAQHWRQIGR
jgi:hypothetical protein